MDINRLYVTTQVQSLLIDQNPYAHHRNSSRLQITRPSSKYLKDNISAKYAYITLHLTINCLNELKAITRNDIWLNYLIMIDDYNMIFKKENNI